VFTRAAGNRTRLTYPDNTYVSYEYDTLNRLTDVRNQAGTALAHYTYDATYQLTEVDYPAGLSYLATDTEFNYDAAGNRPSVIDGSGTTPYTTNNLNQYTQADGAYFRHDTSGNMTYDGHKIYRYDPENRLTQVKRFEQGPGELAQGADTDLTFTTGGSADWSRQTADGYFEADCTQSGTISNSQESWLQTTVSGAGTLTFYWKVSSSPRVRGFFLALRYSFVYSDL
jgi:YD repeat-containing protein